MAQGYKASGALTFDIDVNSSKAFQAVNQMKRGVNELNKEMHNYVEMAKDAGNSDEALKIRREYLTKQLKEQENVTKQLMIIQKESQNLTDVDSYKMNKLGNELSQAKNKTQNLENQLTKLNRIMLLQNQSLEDSNNKVRYNNQFMDTRVSRLREEGRELQANSNQLENYRQKIRNVQDQQKQQKNTLSNYEDTFSGDDLSKDTHYQKLRIEYERSGQALAKLKNEQADYASGLTNAVQQNKVFENGTKSLTNRIKEESGVMSAGYAEFHRLQQQRKNDLNVYSLQEQKLKRIKEVSGETSLSYQKEKAKLDDIGGSYAKHSRRLNETGKQYKWLGEKGALASDKLTRKARSFKTFGNEMTNASYKARSAVTGLGLAFVYGSKQATALQDSYIKINNLLVTGGEKQAEVTKNVAEMQNNARKYSIEYGKSQKSIADGYEELVRRGYTSNQAIASQKTFIEGSIATGDKYSDVVKNGTSALESFGKRTDSTSQMLKNSKEVINQMSYAADLTATDFQGMGDAIRYVGATANSTNQSLSTTSSAIGILSNNGLWKLATKIEIFLKKHSVNSVQA